ncbi:MAG: hypothetical protein M0R16_08790 [Bacteroidales bacterium]|jgi:hypothetical protein|nr:hypothetical protein [Bacteroidales bacterium]
MKKINLELSPDQYKELLRLVYSGNWILDEPENIVLNDLVQMIFSQAKVASHEKLVSFDDNMQLYMPSDDFDDEMVDIIEDFEDECFWSHLSYRLAERDAGRQAGQEFEKMNLEEKLVMLERINEKYVSEFDENGLENIEIKNS